MKQNNNNGLEITATEVKRIEIRSEEVQDILGTLPHWTVRSGSGYLLCLIVAALLISWFIKYPDIIKATAVLTTQNPPVNIVSQTQGYLVLWTKDKEKVQPGQYIGYLKNAADVYAVINLIKKMDTFKTRFYHDPAFISDYRLEDKSNLGELQTTYNSLVSNIRNYQFILQQQEYKKRRLALSNEVSGYSTLMDQQKEQTGIMSGELALSRQLFERDSLLYTQKVISRAEFEQKQKEYLTNQRMQSTTASEITNTQIQKTRLQGRIDELTLDEQNKNKELISGIEMALREMGSRLKVWENMYLLQSPISGIVTLSKYWSNDQFIKSGEEILTVAPEQGKYFVKATVPAAGSGKIKTGQTVNIKISNYPYEEYGIVTGLIQNISLVPKENNYYITISLPQGLATSYGKHIAFSQEMGCEAEVITEDLRLLERFIYKYRKLIR